MPSLKNCNKDFSVFQHHPKLVYLDSTATSLKPQSVINAMRSYEETNGATVHRGVYDLSVKATDLYEGAREKVRQFINAKSTKEIIFTRNATEAINIVANTFPIEIGDVVLVSEMEHHSNIVPWQPLHGWRGVELRWIPVTDDGQLDLSNIDELLKGVKLLAITQMSNVLGTVNDVKMLAQKAHAAGAKILVDGAQSVPHMPVDVQDLDADFLVFSGHKMLGPNGIGVLYAKEETLNELPPFLRGGDMILEVTKEKATWNELPWRFEAGTPNIVGAIGLGAAVDYLQTIGMENMWKHEQELGKYGLEKLSAISGVTILGTPTPPTPRPLRPRAQGREVRHGGAVGRAAIFAFTIEGIHPHDIGSILDEQGIAIRAGHHCAMVLHQRFGLAASARASCYLYTSREDIDVLISGIKSVQEVFV